jgi:hypothetical protein
MKKFGGNWRKKSWYWMHNVNVIGNVIWHCTKMFGVDGEIMLFIEYIIWLGMLYKFAWRNLELIGERKVYIECMMLMLLGMLYEIAGKCLGQMEK